MQDTYGEPNIKYSDITFFGELSMEKQVLKDQDD